MRFLDTVIIVLVGIVLAHLTLKNVLASYDGHASKSELHIENDESHPAADEMLDFIRGHLKDLERNDIRHPKGSNYFNDFHDSDLHDERTDLSKFFDVEQSVPDTKALLREITGGQCGPEAIMDCKEPTLQGLRDPQSGHPMRFDQGSDGTATFLPDQWTYQNEKPMNGAKIDGVRGFDSDAGDYSVYPSSSEVRAPNFITSYPYTTTFGDF